MKMRLKRRRKEIGEGKEETETRIRRLRLLWVFVDKVAAAEVTQRPRDRLILLTKSLSTLTSSTPRLFTTPCRPVSPFLFHLFTSASPHTVFMPSPPPLLLFALSLSSCHILLPSSINLISIFPLSPTCITTWSNIISLLYLCRSPAASHPLFSSSCAASSPYSSLSPTPIIPSNPITHVSSPLATPSSLPSLVQHSFTLAVPILHPFVSLISSLFSSSSVKSQPLTPLNHSRVTLTPTIISSLLLLVIPPPLFIAISLPFPTRGGQLGMSGMESSRCWGLPSITR